ncbi:putative membrane protein [Leucobacter exalbidus]|uniref:Membrane protein n=1 Tax=Leucobacter exalbidus TaxID=662960 RepID=A0A940PU73_9MICO|nr:DUF4870 domain-containing protein [Leucobacter exalbidus]MBP1326893.1 putative membrane protein [Leucobacter exalbidus]
MTTLPPEGSEPQVPGGQPTNDPVVPEAPQVAVPPQAPLPPQQAPQPAAPQAPQAPQAPPAPQYQQPAAPQQPQYQQPGGGQVPPGGYQQPYAQQPTADPLSNITLNYWLSVFFTWIPALIFFLIEKDKGNRQALDYHRENLNFSLLRTGVVIASYILGAIPAIGWLFVVLLWIGSVVLFVFHIMAAAKTPEAYRRGQKPPFIFNIPLIK